MENLYDFDKNRRSTNSEEWLENRFSLFERYCFPSIKHQGNLNFVWFVLFDKQTPQKYYERINSYKISLRQFVPLFLADGMYSTIRQTINQEVQNYLEENDQFIITTRIDNDDAFQVNMINEIQSLFNFQEDIVINFNNGLQYDIEKKVLIKMKYINNHFISRIEKNNYDIETVITYNHAFINDVCKVLYVENKTPLWIEIVHKKNISNHFGLSMPLFSNNIFSLFGFVGQLSYKNSLKLFALHLKKNIILLIVNGLKRCYLYEPLRRIKHKIIKSFV